MIKIAYCPTTATFYAELQLAEVLLVVLASNKEVVKNTLLQWQLELATI